MALGVPVVLSAQTQRLEMPQVEQIAGVPLPSPDLPAGTVSVRVVRNNLRNNVEGQPVELRGGGSPRTATTDANGRATFSELAAGTRATAATVLDGTALQSQEFTIPASGGIRVVLATVEPKASAGESATAGAVSSAQPGVVVLAEQSRFVIELVDGAVEVYCLLEVSNTARVPVTPAAPLVFDTPPEATSLTLLEGTTPQATLEGTRVSVSGPFPPGATVVQIGYRVPYSSSTLSFSQPVPAPLEQASVVVRKLGSVEFTSPQIQSQRDVEVEGRTYIMAGGPGVASGQALTFNLTRLPYYPAWPRYGALLLSALIIVWAVWVGSGPDQSSDRERHTSLEKRRESLFADLVRLEEQRRKGQVADTTYVNRRRSLIDRLERVYATLENGDGGHVRRDTWSTEQRGVSANAQASS